MRLPTLLGAGFAAASAIVVCACKGSQDHTLAGIYQPCNAASECGGPFDCETIQVDYGDVVVTDAACTMSCDTHADCPFDGKCMSVTDAGPLCYKNCFDDLDCPVGFACFVRTEGEERGVCLPWQT